MIIIDLSKHAFSLLKSKSQRMARRVGALPKLIPFSLGREQEDIIRFKKLVAQTSKNAKLENKNKLLEVYGQIYAAKMGAWATAVSTTASITILGGGYAIWQLKIKTREDNVIKNEEEQAKRDAKFVKDRERFDQNAEKKLKEIENLKQDAEQKIAEAELVIKEAAQKSEKAERVEKAAEQLMETAAQEKREALQHIQELTELRNELEPMVHLLQQEAEKRKITDDIAKSVSIRPS